MLRKASLKLSTFLAGFLLLAIMLNPLLTKTQTQILSRSSITGTPPPSSGDWRINDTTIVDNETLIINGSIIVESGGTLILKNSIIMMNVTYDGEHSITVRGGGNLTIICSTITSYDNTHYFHINIESGAIFYMSGGRLGYIGYGATYGLNIYSSNTKILDSYIGDSPRAIYISASNVYMENLSLNVTGNYGVYIANSQNITILKSRIWEPGTSIYIYYSQNCRILGSYMNSTQHGVVLYFSSNITIKDNIMHGCGIYMYGKDDRVVHTIENNTLDGKPIYYTTNQSDMTVEGDYAQVIVTLSENITVKNLYIDHTYYYAIEFIQVNNSRIFNNTFNFNSYSIYLLHSYNNFIRDNNIYGSPYPITLRYSSGNMIERNTIESGVYGIYIYDAYGNQIYSNTISSFSHGIRIYMGTNNTILNNNISKCDTYGIYLENSQANTIYLNNFIQNSQHANDAGSNNFNMTNTGNYWDDYNGTDDNNDGIGDTPYIIDNDSIDYYPLFYPSYMYDDNDNDTLPDWQENQYSTDPNDNDTDDDELSDGWEVNNGTDPLDNDTDDDGLGDGDEIYNGTDPLDNDTDDDGMPDGWELENGLNATDSQDSSQDADGDGLANIYEYGNGTDPLDNDTDDDGWSDYEEIIRGTDPLDPEDYPREETKTEERKTTARGFPMTAFVGVIVLAVVALAALLLFARKRSVGREALDAS